MGASEVGLGDVGACEVGFGDVGPAEVGKKGPIGLGCAKTDAGSVIVQNIPLTNALTTIMKQDARRIFFIYAIIVPH